MKIRRFLQPAAVMALAVATLGIAFAQDLPSSPIPPAPPNAAAAWQAPAPPPAMRSQPSAPAVTPAQLDQIVAPIALYPDQLLGQILMASTYPLEVVEAARWVALPANQALKGDALTDALNAQNWDPSVKALVPFPRVLEIMNTRIEWTEQLGNVFLAQQADVMDAVQRLRKQAMAAGNLKTTPQCGCRVETNGDTIAIQLANPRVVCVPVYHSAEVYGAWPYPLYPPVDFPPPVGFAFAPGLFIGFGGAIELAAYGPIWGWGNLDWAGRRIVVDPALYAAIGGGAILAGNVWMHNSAHRGGGAYNNPAAGARFGGRVVPGGPAGGRAAAFGRHDARHAMFGTAHAHGGGWGGPHAGRGTGHIAIGGAPHGGGGGHGGGHSGGGGHDGGGGSHGGGGGAHGGGGESHGGGGGGHGGGGGGHGGGGGGGHYG
jgi:hypothetical protein